MLIDKPNIYKAKGCVCHMVKKKKVKVENTTQTFPVKYLGEVRINDKKLINDFVCAKCLKEIKLGERFVLLGTYDFKDKDDELLDVGFISEYFYHMQCWVDYFNQKVIERLTNSKTQAMEMFRNNPMFNNLVKNVQLLKV